MENIVDLLRNEIVSFFDTIKNEKWVGKEREIVSRFAFSNLLNLINKDVKFYSSGQIGVEVRVKQVNNDGKKEVCKDLIIWKFPYQTVWSSDDSPLIIIEWKCNNKNVSQYDIDWLQKYISVYPDTVGIAINIDNKNDYSLKAALIANGKSTNINWINI